MIRIAFIVLTALAIQACGGGGSPSFDEGSPPPSGGSSSGSSSSSNSSSNSSSSGSTPPGTCGDAEARAVFTSNNCLGCHNAQAFVNLGGNLNLDSGNVGLRLLGRSSQHGGSACSDELLIDPEQASNSLLLKLTNEQKLAELKQGDCQRQSMPPSNNFMSASDHSCLSSWVQNVIDNNVVTPTPTPAPGAFKATAAEEALSKAKYFLHGGAPSEAELQSLGGSGATPSAAALKNVIQTWENSENYQTKLMQFLDLSLQQRTEPRSRYIDQFNNIFSTPRDIDPFALVSNLSEVFLKTAFNIVEQEQDFRQVVSTRRWQVTTAALVAIIYADKENQSPGRTYLQSARVEDRLKSFAHLQESDYSDWRTVEFTQATTSHDYTNSAEFAASIRAIPEGGSVPLLFPRVGFFSTPSFLELWGTNDDNQFRVTTQQTLISALDTPLDPSDPTAHLSEDGIAFDHVDPTSACYQCHRRMDPMRLIFSNFQVSKHRAKTPDTSIQPQFVLKGVAERPSTVDEFAQHIVDHPFFPEAWVQKLCMWGNSQRCDATDPEFVRIKEYFVSQNFNLKLLIREFFSSPIFNASALVKTHETQDFIVSMTRGSHFCAAVSARIEDMKAANGSNGNPRFCDNENNFGIIPPDDFGRGKADFIQNVRLAAFDAKSIDRTCGQVGNQMFASNKNRVIDTNESVANIIDQITQSFVGIPSNHNRYQATKSELQRVYDIASHQSDCPDGVNPAAQDTISCGYGLNKTASLRAVWFSACTSPDVIGLGF